MNHPWNPTAATPGTEKHADGTDSLGAGNKTVKTDCYFAGVAVKTIKLSGNIQY